MKTIKFLLGLLAVLSLLNCNNKQSPEKEEVPIKVESPKPPSKIIPLEQAMELYNTYTERRVPIIQKYEINNNRSEFHPTRYAEYDYKTIKEYILYIENEAKKAKVDITKLRFYFTTYPNAEKFKNGAQIKYPGHNSFFMVPTIKNKNRHDAFYTITEKGGNTKSYFIENRKNELYKNKASFFSFKQAERINSLILNEAGLIPPPRDHENQEMKN